MFLIRYFGTMAFLTITFMLYFRHIMINCENGYFQGIAPLLPIFRESILNGAPELKEAAANGLGEIIKLTSVDALKPSVVHITGPLIRILGDRFSHNVKTAVLDTLAILLSKASAMLKPFLPQLQTTFLKALNDPHRTVRLKAGFALSHLITIHTR